MDSIASKVRHGLAEISRHIPRKSGHKTTNKIAVDQIPHSTTDTKKQEMLRQCVFILTKSGINNAFSEASLLTVTDDFIRMVTNIANAEITGYVDERQIKVPSDAGLIRIKQNVHYGTTRLIIRIEEDKFEASQFPDIISLQNQIRQFIQKITFLQACLRRYNATAIPEPWGEVTALRYPDGTVFAYKTGSDNDKHLGWSCFPPAISNTNIHLLQSGGHKTLTHRDNNWIGLTIHKEPGQVDSSILKIIADNQFDKIVPQFRVNKMQMLAKNLGKDDLFEYLWKGYRFKVAHFVELAKQIHHLHELGIVHRDIKPENMFLVKEHIQLNKVSIIQGYLKSGNWQVNEDEDEPAEPGHICLYSEHIYLSDLDSMGKPGEFTDDFCTKEYLTRQFLRHLNDNAPRDKPYNAYEKDQFTFFLSMMIACAGSEGFPTDEKPDHFIPEYIYRFIRVLPCSAAMQSELIDFLLCPADAFLKAPLHHYLLPSCI